RSRAPELSATLSLDSCWITRSLGLLQDLDQAPALGAGNRPGLDHPDQIPLSRLVACIVGVQGARAAHDLLVLGMAPSDFDGDSDRLVRLAGDHSALPGLATGGAALGGRRAAAGLALRAALRPVGGAAADGPLAGLAARGGALLGTLLLPRLGRAPGSLQATTSLPVEAFQGIVLGGGFLSLLLLRGGLLIGRSLLSGGLILGRGIPGRSLLLGLGLILRSLLGSLLFVLLLVALFV